MQYLGELSAYLFLGLLIIVYLMAKALQLQDFLEEEKRKSSKVSTHPTTYQTAEVHLLDAPPWCRRLGFLGCVVLLIGASIWYVEIRSGISDPPSMQEHIAVWLITLGILACMPMLMKMFVNAAEIVTSQLH